mmetsp:Transcript_10213/g.24815  ORF Transcript_10213/g.24815 Transcript_10213/m.24815 type:complete len:211 (-) Transcript_10213:83-715(-)
MTQVSSIHRNGFSGFLKDSNIFPNNFFVTEGWPAMDLRFGNKLLGRSVDGSYKKCFSGDRIVECDGCFCVHNSFLKRSGLEVTAHLGKMSVEVANLVRKLVVGTIQQITLDRLRTRSMLFLRHDFFSRELNLSTDINCHARLWGQSDSHDGSKCCRRGDLQEIFSGRRRRYYIVSVWLFLGAEGIALLKHQKGDDREKKIHFGRGDKLLW